MLSRTSLMQNIAIALLCAVAAPVFSDEPTSGAPEIAKKWNDPNLPGWMATLGGSKSKYDGLASTRQFEIYQKTIEHLKRMVLHDAVTEQEAGEGLRMILKLTAQAVTDSINTDFRKPLLARLDTRYRDVGAYNPDAEYDQAWIDGKYDYKIVGNVGTIPYLSVTVNASTPKSRNEIVGYMNDEALRKFVDTRGNITVWLTKQKPSEPGAWIKIPPEARGVVIRQYIGNRLKEKMASFTIDAVGESLPPSDPMSDDEIAQRIARIAGTLVINSTWHRTLMPYAMEKPNVFFEHSGTALGGNIANSENLYDMAHFQIAADEALVIDFIPPASTPFWNLTSATIWHESQHYLTEPVSITMEKAIRRADGSVRIFLAHRDPGAPNWIKTFDHNRGFLIFRVVGVEKNPLPKVTKIKFADIRNFK